MQNVMLQKGFVQIQFFWKIFNPVLKEVDTLSNSFSVYMSIQRHWHDSRLQIQWSENETLKYLPSGAAENFWFPWIHNPHVLASEFSERVLTLNALVTDLLFWMNSLDNSPGNLTP